MEMQKTCDLELRLLLPCYDSDFHSSVEESSSSSEIPKPKQETQIPTIFYNGQMCVSSELTHHQAKAILSLASRDMKERTLSLTSSSDGSDPPIIPNNLTRYHRQKASMTRSLRSFLQKRNDRIQATCPYYHSR